MSARCARYRVRAGWLEGGGGAGGADPGRSRSSVVSGNYEGTITADFREYIFDGTIERPDELEE